MSKLTFWEKVSMRFHLIMCPPCKKYGHDSDKLDSALKNCKEEKVFPEKSKIELKAKVRNS